MPKIIMTFDFFDRPWTRGIQEILRGYPSGRIVPVWAKSVTRMEGGST